MANQHNQDLGYVLSSDYRTRIVLELSQTPRLPSELHESTDIELPHVSRTLSDLRERDIVTLLVDEDTRKGRLYGVTDKGEALASELKNR